jgi:hypothetical protein
LDRPRGISEKKSRGRGRDERLVTDRDGQWDFGTILGAGLLVGLQPSEAKALSLVEYFAMIDSWAEAHDTSSHGNKLSGDEKDEIWEWMQSKKIPLTLKEAREKANGAGH